MDRMRFRHWRWPSAVVLALLIVGTSLGSASRDPVAAASLASVQDTLQMAEMACTQLFQGLANDTNSGPYKSARECISAADHAHRALPPRFVEGDFSRLARIFMTIPEYHDEQRLAAGSNVLGPKAYAYASPHLDDFIEQWQVATHGTRGFLAGYVYVDLLTGEHLPETYKQLHLVAGMNCVFLARPAEMGGLSGGWMARIVPATVVNQEHTCDPAENSPYANRLQVVMQRAPNMTIANYPPVIRFGESEPGGAAILGAPLIGVRCLDAWCEIGASPFKPSKSIAENLPSFAAQLPMKARVKGWYDEQVLTDRTPPEFLFTPVIRAALVPADGIEHWSPRDFDNNWKDVAAVVFPTSTAGTKYESMGLQRGINRIQLRRFGPKWEVQMIPPSGTPRAWRYLRREEHQDVGVPGTARFRWTLADDGFWLPCGMACCQVEG